MKPADIDWSVLRGALVLLAIAVVISTGALYASEQFSDKVQREYRSQDAQLRSIRSRYQSIDEEERLIEVYLPRYRALEERGVIGREYRLDWIETLRTASQELKLPALRYSIETQEEHVPDVPLQGGMFKVYASNMSLQLGLLHEGDLPALLDRLGADVKGMYRVTRCSMSRVGQVFGNDPVSPNVDANCVLQWYTVRQPDPESPA